MRPAIFGFSRILYLTGAVILTGVGSMAAYAADKPATPVAAPPPPPPPQPIFVPPVNLPPVNSTFDAKDPAGSWRLSGNGSASSLQCSVTRNTNFAPPPPPAAPGAAPAAPVAPPPQVTITRIHGVDPAAPSDTIQVDVSSNAMPEKTGYSLSANDRKIDNTVLARSYSRSVSAQVTDVKSFLSNAGKGISVTLDEVKLELPGSVTSILMTQLDSCISDQEKALKEATAKHDEAVKAAQTEAAKKK